MDDGSGINFGDALKYPSLEFVERPDSDMAKKTASHFAKQGFDDVEPRAVLGSQDVLKTVGARGEKRPRLFGNVCGMIVQDYADGALRRIPRVEVGQQADEFHAAVTILHARRDVAILEIQCRQYRTRAQPLILMIPADLPILARHRRQIRRGIGDGLHAGLFIHRNRDDAGSRLASGPLCIL